MLEKLQAVVWLVTVMPWWVAYETIREADNRRIHPFRVAVWFAAAVVGLVQIVAAALVAWLV